jgi:hypothetical protein
MKKHEKRCCPKKLKKFCKTNNCDLCDFVAKDGGEMRRHMRDKHDVTTHSTSPPPKKTKVQSRESDNEGRISDDDNEKVENISLGVKHMEIDENEATLEVRSNFWDTKINRKEEKVVKEDIVKEKKKKEIKSKKIVEDKNIWRK